MIEKPGEVFDRSVEWRHLVDFVERDDVRPALGVVSGRRRQGKTYLLEALTRAGGGFYFGATQATEAESLRLFGEALGTHTGAAVPPRFANWDEAMRHLFTARLTGPVVIDEFPYLSRSAPALPSILQREIDRGVSQATSIRLLLCGSALSVMGRLLSGSAPLRGRANLELIVRPFAHRLAAQYWGVHDPRLAFLLHAVVGHARLPPVSQRRRPALDRRLRRLGRAGRARPVLAAVPRGQVPARRGGRRP